jgi:peptidoglycan/LPS O-acetylase OafA/YrhL
MPPPPTHSNALRAPRVHLGFLDGLRALAALTVVLLHVEQNVWVPFKDEVPTWFYSAFFWVASGRYAVSLFIVISGFCLMLPVVRAGGSIRGGAIGHFRRRAWRILPTYYGSLAFALALILTLIGTRTGGTWDLAIPPTAQGLWTHVFLVQNWAPFFHPDYRGAIVDLTTLAAMPRDVMKAAFARMFTVLGATQNINPPAWSIAVECQIYLLFPWLVRSWRFFGPFRTVAMTMLSFGFFFWFHSFLNLFMCPHFVALFAMGMLGAQIAFGAEARWERWRAWRGWGWSALALWGLIFSLNAASRGALFFVSYIVDFFAGIASMCLLVAASRPRPSRALSVFSAPPLVFIGGFSYSLYLVHMPVLEVLYRLVTVATASKAEQFGLLTVPGLACIVLVSYGFFWLCERPFATPRRAEQRDPRPEVTSPVQAG